MLRPFLLAPCLLICLACATPFPLENLEEGMTTETVREKFGEPEAMGLTFGVYPKPPESYWTYVDQELDIAQVIIGWPWAPLFVAMSWLPSFEWDDPYMSTSDVVLHFEAEKLVRWEVIEPVYSGYYDPALFPTMTFPSIDAAHHARGHKHHHPDC